MELKKVHDYLWEIPQEGDMRVPVVSHDIGRLLTLTDQNLLSRERSSLWNESPGEAGFTCRSKAVILTAFCSSPDWRASSGLHAFAGSVY